MIETFRAQGFGCLKNVTVQLTPLHALIGPNDSGKSTLLHAIDTMGHYAKGQNLRAIPHWRFIAETKGKVRLEASGPFTCTIEGTNTELFLATQPPLKGGTQRIIANQSVSESPDASMGLGGVRILRLDPDQMRLPSALMPLDNPEAFFTGRGQGLAGFLGSINIRGDVEPIQQIQAAMHERFPDVRRVSSVPVNNQTVALELVLQDGIKVLAAEISEGLLYYLAFLILQYLESVKILLIEEPENGLHPSRIGDVIDVCRHLTETKGVQVIMSTHSPLVINELKPEEVSVVTRADPEVGTVIRPLNKTPNFEARSKVLNLGELWLSYANGKDEAPLFEEPPGL